MTPQHILDAVLATVEKVAGEALTHGKAVVVSDEFQKQNINGKTQLGAMLVPRDQAFALVEERSSLPADAIEQLRNTPSCKVPVIYSVGEHFGGLAYEPAWSCS